MLDEAKAAFRAWERPLSEGGADAIRSTLAYLLMTRCGRKPGGGRYQESAVQQGAAAP